MVRKESQIPYLASIMICQGVPESALENFKDPTRYDQHIYDQYGQTVLERLQTLKNDSDYLDKFNKLPQRTPAPTPATGPAGQTPLTLPPPASAYHVPPPGMLLPSPVPHYAVPPPLVPAFTLHTPAATRANNVRVSTTSSTSRLSQEFFREKNAILVDDDAVETSKQKEAETLLKKQLEAKEMMKKTSSRSNDPLNYASARALNNIDQAIANLDREIQQQSHGRPETQSSSVDRFGYVIRNTAQSSTDPAAESSQGQDSRRRKRSRSKSPSSNKRRRRSSSRSRGRPTRSRSRNRRRSRSRVRRSKSRSRHTRTKSRSRGRTTRSRSRERRRRSRSRRRRKGSRSPIRLGSRPKSPVKRRSKSKSKDKNYSCPPVPAFMLHPADRLFSGEETRSKSVRKRMDMRKEHGYDQVNTTPMK